MINKSFLIASFLLIGQVSTSQESKSKPMNIIFILADDHRYDAMGFMNKIKGLETPGMDRMAKEGAHIKNAFVSTALCSPSRASILTGQYAHTHTVVDNEAALPENLVFFPSYMQQKGYQTAFLGKWHMGNDRQPGHGFDWTVTAEARTYSDPTYFVNGKETPRQGARYR